MRFEDYVHPFTLVFDYFASEAYRCDKIIMLPNLKYRLYPFSVCLLITLVDLRVSRVTFNCYMRIDLCTGTEFELSVFVFIM